MKVVLTHPFCWPHVRRGSERFLEGLVRFLVGQGHQVTVLSTRPGHAETMRQNGATYVLRRQPRTGALDKVGLGADKRFSFGAVRDLVKLDADVVHCLYHADGCAARIARARTGIPYIVHIAGIPVARHFNRRPIDNAFLRFALAGAAAVDVSSESARQHLREGFGRDARMLHVPIDIGSFTVRVGRDLERPRIVSVGAFGDRQKGARVLARSFDFVKRSAPGAVLQFVGRVPEPLRLELLRLVSAENRADVVFPGLVSEEDLRAYYSSAAVAVLPSVWENFPLVLIEALACGTPVTGTNHGGIPEIIRPDIGTVFEPGDDLKNPSNAEGLADAIVRALALHRDARIAHRCRARAEELTWPVLGPGFERLELECAGLVSPSTAAPVGAGIG